MQRHRKSDMQSPPLTPALQPKGNQCYQFAAQLSRQYTVHMQYADFLYPVSPQKGC